MILYHGSQVIVEYPEIKKARYHKDFIEKSQMTKGDFDNVAECQYHVPDYWTIGEVYHSWISDSISDYNTDFYFQPRDYIAACYECGLVLE